MTMKPCLYPHQRRAIREIRVAIAKRGARVVLSCPTAGGKTRIAAEIIRAMLKQGKRVTFTAPKLEIINQTVDRLIEAGVPSSKVGVIQAQHERTDASRPVQVASVQTVARRDFPKTDLVIIDECHEQFETIRRWMGAAKKVPFLGLSATPWARGMADNWTNGVIEVGDTQSLIGAGVLCDFRVFLRERYDTRTLHIRNGDYVRNELNEAAKDARVTADIIKSWKKHGQSRPTVAFCVSREHAESLTKRFTAANITAAYMDADTPEKMRADIRARFHAGEIKVICNVGVLTTGADWNIGCIIMARPTQSKILFVQIIGRGLRNPPGKTDCLILDHTNNHELHGRVTDIEAEGLRGAEVKDADYFRSRGPVVTQCEACSGDVALNALKCPHCEAPMPRSVLEEREHIQMVEIAREKGISRRSKAMCPPGFENIATFARRLGVTKQNIKEAIERGLPSHQKLIHVTAALEWIRQDKTRSELESLRLEASELRQTLTGATKLKAYDPRSFRAQELARIWRLHYAGQARSAAAKAIARDWAAVQRGEPELSDRFYELSKGGARPLSWRALTDLLAEGGSPIVKESVDQSRGQL